MRNIEDIRSMSYAQVVEENKRLAVRAFATYVGIHAVKWVAIIGLSRAARKALAK